MIQIVGILFGPSWKTSLLGLAGGAALALTTYLQAHQGDGLAWYVAAAAVALAGRLFSDSGASPGKSIKDLLLGGAPGSTLLGALAPVSAAVVTYAQGQQGLGWYVLAAVIPLVLRFAKVPVVDAAAASAPPKGFSLLALLPALAAAALLAAWLVTPAPAHAQVTQPAAAPTAPLAVQLTPDLSLRLNVSVVAGSYDLTHKAWLGQGEIGGLYALTSKRLLDAGIIAGGSLTFDTASRPSGTLNGGLVSPKLPISPALALHGAILYGRRFGPDAADLFRICPTLEF
jgi:hypothetical protein